jgi:hypothetical protein
VGGREFALHQHGVNPPAVLETDLGEPPRVGEPAATVQRGGRALAAAGDDRDHLPRAGVRAAREQRGEQQPAKPSPRPAWRQVHRVLNGVTVRRFGPPGAGVGVPDDLRARFGYQEWQRELAQVREFALPVPDGRRRFLERRDAVRDVVSEDVGDRREVRGSR